MLRITSTFSFVGTLSLVSLVSAQSYSETYLGCFSVATGWAVAESSPTATSITECNVIPTHITRILRLTIAYASLKVRLLDVFVRRKVNIPIVGIVKPPTYNNALIGYGGNHFNCICLNESLDLEGEAQQCGQSGLYFAYIHTPASSASTVERRRRRLERMKRDEQLRLNRFCPSRLEACVVPGSEDSLECIDTSSELESCGGCLYGSYSNSTSSNGTDCSTLSGAAFGGSTCFDGRCQISACEEGFKIVDGRCQ
ncbi:hypothetical protein L486_01951 [Kwoniella mangroviensis CBS 10435]|uniref:Protein CPL1-like domain-containing protein n=1 Tax=Kwoniella mangroviensis CBS 10435 TaxID=1331196 RepID=A0A1B9J3B8_9TREE|nr:hypothetical protein L486_01951 [Kwoniella mangroviensis CBS 10435]